MKINNLVFCAGILLSPLSMPVHADTTDGTTTDASVTAKPATDNVQSTAPSATPIAPQEILTARQVPKISLSWDCGDCDHNEKVFPLLEENYRKVAKSKGYTVSDSETAEVVITEYRQRPPGLRVMFGVFAGKDKLSTRITYRGKEYIAKDYEANAFTGMNGLCVSVAKRAFKQIISALDPNCRSGCADED